MDLMPHSNPAITDTDERVLLKRIAARERSALEAIYRSYHPKLFKFVFRLTSSYATADELVNDVMLIVWDKADSFRGDSTVSTWIFGIAYRVTMRRVSRRKHKLTSAFALDQLVADEPSVEVEDWVQRGISQLPDAQKVTVVLVFWLGLSYEEAARVTDCPVNTVKTRMYHARRKLKALLDESENSAPDAGEITDA